MLSYQAIEPHTLELLKRLFQEPLFSGTRLVGGTALALQFGHRISVDLDFFGEIEHDTAIITDVVSGIGKTVIGRCTDRIKTFYLDHIKIDYIDYSKYPWIDTPVIEDNITLASPRDIAAMKINAIEGRGTRKDFVDMFYLLKHFSLSDILSFYMAKYPEHSEYRALLSLTYFEDAETAPMPTMLTDTRWDEIKETICKEVEIYNKKRLNL